MRPLALALIALLLVPDLADAARRSRQQCLFFCAPHQRHHARGRRHRPVYVPADAAALPSETCRQVNEAVAGLNAGRAGEDPGRRAANIERIRRTMSKRQIEVMDKCAAGAEP